MKFLLSIFLLFSVKLFAGDPIPCAPPAKKINWFIPATHVTARDGDWFSPSTWASGVVPSENDNVDLNHFLTAPRNIIRRSGRVYSSTKRARIKFTGINVSRFVGGGMDPLPDDIGFWIMGDAQLQLEGEEKESWSNLVGSANKGMTVINVKNTAGWKPQDEIVVFTNEVPPHDPVRVTTTGIGWNDATNQGQDPLTDKFERFRIVAVSGTAVTLDRPLKYDHLQTVTDLETFTCEVANLTRSIVIEGTGRGAESHIFIRSSKPQTIRYVEGRFLGVTKPGNRDLNLVQGRYDLHFHHCMEGSSGSIVEGCSFHDSRNRVYVPHMSNGISFIRNVAFNSTQEQFWWDFQHQSHRILYKENLMGLRVYNGSAGGVTGMELGQGDGNAAIGNVAVGVHHGDLHQQGAYAWNANNQGVWIFDFNVSKSNGSGGFVWQNTGAPHAIIGHKSINNVLGWWHGAYINSYYFVGLNFYNSRFGFEATPGNLTPMVERSLFDGGGKIPYVIEAVSSPTPTSPNIFRDVTLKGFTRAAVLINTRVFTGEIGRKGVDLVYPTVSGKLVEFDPQSIYNSYLRIQPKGGGQSQMFTQAGTTNISAFAPTMAGTGTGLIGYYYNGANFNSLAFERLDIMLKFQGWTIDKGSNPTGVDYRITPGGPFSVRWRGKYQAPRSGQIVFSVKRLGGARLTFDNKLILDRWQETNEKDLYFDAAAVVVEAGKMYDVVIEHFNIDGGRGFEWFTKENGVYTHVPISQLYPLTSPGPPPPQPVPNRPPTVNAGADLTLQKPDSVIKVEGEANDLDTNLAKVTWTGPAGVELSQTLSESSHALAKIKTAGSYELTITATDRAGLTASDKMILTVLPAVVVPPPGDPCTTFVWQDYISFPENEDLRRAGIDTEGEAINHYNRYGKQEGRKINKLCNPIPVPVWPKIGETFPYKGKKIVVYENEDGTWIVKIE